MLALGDGKLSADDYATLIDEEEARMKAITALYEENEDYYINELATEEIKDMMANLKDNWVLVEPETQKPLVQSMFRQIVKKKNQLGGPSLRCSPSDSFYHTIDSHY